MGWYKYRPTKNIKDVLEEKGKIKRSKGIEEYLKKEGVKFKTDKNYDSVKKKTNVFKPLDDFSLI